MYCTLVRDSPWIQLDGIPSLPTTKVKQDIHLDMGGKEKHQTTFSFHALNAILSLATDAQLPFTPVQIMHPRVIWP